MTLRNRTTPTLSDAIAALREEGITIRLTMFGGEYRVNYTNGREATAYYTDDPDDAIATGWHMVASGAKEPK